MSKRHTPAQIVGLLRQAEVDQGNGLTIGQVCQKLAIREQNFHHGRYQYAGLKQDEARRLKELEAENGRLKRLVADSFLNKQMLQEVANKMLTATARRYAVGLVRETFGVSERGASEQRLVVRPLQTHRLFCFCWIEGNAIIQIGS
jgi:hypothetical protein